MTLFPSTLGQHRLPQATRRSASWPSEPQTVRAGWLRAIHLTNGYKWGARGLEAGGISQVTRQVWNPGRWAPIPGSLLWGSLCNPCGTQMAGKRHMFSGVNRTGKSRHRAGLINRSAAKLLSCFSRV